MAELKDNVHSPYMSERKRLKLHKLREDVRRRYSVIGPSVLTWNMLGDDFDRATDGKYKQKHDPEELIRFWQFNKERYDFLDAEHRREIDFFFRQRDQALQQVRQEKGNRLCRQLCEHLIPSLFQLLHLVTTVGMNTCFVFVVPDSPPNDGHLSAPKEKDDDEDDDWPFHYPDDDDDDDPPSDDNLFSPKYYD
jgi:hypothetical protein